MTKPKTPTTTLRSLNLELKKKELEEIEEKVKIDRERILIDKIDILRHLLAETTVDENTAPFSDGSKYKSIFDASEADVIKGKLFQLIHKL